MDHDGLTSTLQSRNTESPRSGSVQQDAAPQIRPRWWVGGLTGGGGVIEVVKAR